MVTDSSAPATLALPLPRHAHTAACELARAHRVSLHAVLLAASMHAGQDAGHDGRRPLDKGRLVRDAETFLTRTGSNPASTPASNPASNPASTPASNPASNTSRGQRYTSDSGDVLIRVAEDPADHTFRVELTPLSARIPADRQWRLWNRFVTFLEAPPSDITAVARTLATRAPDTVAIEDDHDRFTYGDLVRLADAAAGLGAPGSVIGVLGPAGARFWATVFALYDAGLTYVPLDAGQPVQRLESMVRTAGCALIVDTADTADTLGTLGTVQATATGADLCAPAPIVAWKQLNDLPPAPPDTARRAGLAADQVASITFTSAPAGAPQGVQVPRGALTRLATWAACEMELACGTVVSHATTDGHDASAWEVWPALSAGAHVKIVPDDVRADPGAFVPWLRSRHVEVALAPTPIAEMLVGMPWPARADLRVLAAGGEGWLPPIPSGLPFAVLDLYGPAGCAMVSAAAWVEPQRRMPPVGRVVPHLYHRVVDDNGAPVAPGAVGELWLGGPGLPLGFAGRPEQTAERFIPDPYATCAQRVYRTGDIVRERPDGRLDFLRRAERRGRRVTVL